MNYPQLHKYVIVVAIDSYIGFKPLADWDACLHMSIVFGAYGTVVLLDQNL